MGIYVRDLMKGARNFFKVFGVKPAEEVLFIADAKTEQVILDALAAAGEEFDAKTIFCIMPRQKHRMEPPPKSISQAMYGADVFATIYPAILAHEESALRARWDYGARQSDIIVDAEGLASEFATFPLEIMFSIALKLLPIYKKSHTVKLTDEKGTNLVADIDPNLYIGTMSYCEFGHVTNGLRCTFPLGVFGFVPGGINGTSNGVVYFDVFEGFPGKLEKPIKYTIENKRIVDVAGGTGNQAEIIKKWLKIDENANNHAEMMFGLNPKADLGRALKPGTIFYGRSSSTCRHVAYRLRN